eukprot:701014-Ditylum_brightwellii.AAC.1
MAHGWDLHCAIQMQPGLMASYISEFHPTAVLKPLLHPHSHWHHMQANLTQGLTSPLYPIPHNTHQNFLTHAITH